MTQTDFESYLSFVSLADDGYTLLLNSESKYSARLPMNISRKKAADKQKAIETTILNACNSFGMDYVSEDNIRQCAKEVVNLMYERARVTKNNYIAPPTPPVIDEKYHNDYFEYFIDCIKKTVKEEDALIRQITYTKLSAYSNDPINLGVLAPTSTGKSYPIIEVAKFTPLGREVRIVGSMTPKVLIREQGVLVDKDYKPIAGEVRRLKNAILKARYKRKFDEVDEYQSELAALLDGSAYILDLTNKTLIFIDAPNPELWNLLKPILSHDYWEMEHPFVDNVGHGLEVKRVITRGWPACIFCSARDESKWDIWPEIESRFMMASPNMVKVKYHAGNKLIAQRKGLPNAVKQQIIISDIEKESAKNCFLHLKRQIQQFTNATDSPVWIPFGERLADILPSDKGQDNRATNRFYTILNIITLTKAHLRHKLIFDNEKLVIATLNDLQETLHVMQNMTGIPPHKLKFYHQYILSLYKARQSKLKTKDISDFYNANAPKGAQRLNSDNIKKTYLDELVNHSYLEQELDEETKKTQYVFTPLVDIDEDEEEQGGKEQQGVYITSNVSNLSRFDKNLQYSKLLLPENHTGIPEDWLKQEFSQLSSRRNTSAPLKILDPNGEAILIDDFVKSYETEEIKFKSFFKLSRCFDNKNPIEITTSERSEPVDNEKNATNDNQDEESLSNRSIFDRFDNKQQTYSRAQNSSSQVSPIALE